MAKPRYGYRHQQIRAAWQARIDAGEDVRCWRPKCGRPLTGRRWHLGHDDWSDAYRGPECIRCNLEAAARKTNTIKADKAKTVTPRVQLDW